MKRHHSQLILILVLAFGARLIYARLLWTPWFKSPDTGQALDFTRNCYLLAAGLGYSGADAGSPADQDFRTLLEKARQGTVITSEFKDTLRREGMYPEMLHPFGWAGLAVALHWLTGVHIEAVMQTAGAVVDTGATALIYALAVLCLRNRRIGLVSSLIYAVFPPSLFLSTRLFPLAFMPFFCALATVCIVLATRVTGMRRAMYYVLVGVVLGVGSYFRSDSLLLGPFFFFGLWAYHRRFWASSAAGLGIFAVSMALLLPWAWRNHEICGRWIFTSSSAGVTLVTGLGAYPNPWDIGGTDRDRMREAEAQGFKRWSDPRADAYFRKKFLDAVKQHPDAYVKILCRRSIMPIAVPLDWGIAPPEDSVSYTKLRRSGRVLSSLGAVVKRVWSRLLSSGFMFVALIGWVFLCWREWRRHPLIVFLLLVPVYMAASHVLTYMAPYYLWPGTFAQLLGAGYLLSGEWRGSSELHKSPLSA